MDIKALEIPRKHLENVAKNLKYNEIIGDYYRRFISDAEIPTLEHRYEKKLERLQECNSLWDLDVYHKSLVKDFKKTNLCGDKFCNNCKKVKQASRMAKFMPEIQRVGKEYQLSQMVLTVPNVSGAELQETIKLITKAFTELIKYLKQQRNIKGIEIDIGYVGAIRSLEVTYKDDDYHPHLHVLLAHSQNIGLKKQVNKYSYDKFQQREIRRFSDFEVLIQKLWCLLFTDCKEQQSEDRKRRKKITKERITTLETGFSSMIDEFKEEDFIELFKYMTKGDGADHKEDSASSIMSYENFKVLYHSLLNVRQIQGYGEFFRIKDDEELFDGVEESYQKIISGLLEKEKPEQIRQSVQALREDVSYTLISKKQIFKFIKLN